MPLRALFLAFLFLCSCGAGEPEPAAPPSACREQAFDGSRFTVCPVPLKSPVLLFAAGAGETPLRSFSEVAHQVDARNVAFGMNAGMFDENGRPIGLAVATHGSGHKINLRDGPGNFHMKPNGVFIVTASGRATIVPSGRIPEFRAAPRLMTQSGPMLVIDGKLHPKFDADGSSRLIRNGVGVTEGGQAIFAISEEPVSFGKFARLFRDGLHTSNALFLDGSVSSLWDPANGRQDSFVPLGPIIVVLKPGASAPDRGARARP